MALMPQPEPMKITIKDVMKITIKDVLAEKIMGKDASEKLKEYNEAKEVQKRIQDLWRAIDRDNRAHETSVKELRATIERIQEKCKHQATEFHPRANAESDDWTGCLICGKVLS
jgi:SMC interacting uncharacterized protein involved in chromosome segregation